MVQYCNGQIKLAGAATLPELFDAIITQYRFALNFFKLEDAGMVLERGAKEGFENDN